MRNTVTSNALRLAKYIESISDFDFIEPEMCPYKDHIGALFTDTILQAGLNYRSVVYPRVMNVLNSYPEAKTVSSFAHVLETKGTKNVLQWNNQEKIRRMNELVTFCLDLSIESSDELSAFLLSSENTRSLKSINGIGDKTCDYMMRLLGFDIVAVDRHVRNFVSNADVLLNDYFDIREVVEYAADLMDMSRRMIDYSIWSYMSTKATPSKELCLDFQDY